MKESSRRGGTGIHARLKISWSQDLVGSSPTGGKKNPSANLVFLFIFATIKAMPALDKLIKEIEKLLDQNFIFDPYFKLEVKGRLNNLSAAKLAALQKILKEANEYQQKMLAEKIAEDKSVYRRLLAEKKKYDLAVMDIYQKKLAASEKKKIGALLARLKHL